LQKKLKKLWRTRSVRHSFLGFFCLATYDIKPKKGSGGAERRHPLLGLISSGDSYDSAPSAVIHKSIGVLS
jgi:hypothetical protein